MSTRTLSQMETKMLRNVNENHKLEFSTYGSVHSMMENSSTKLPFFLLFVRVIYKDIIFFEKDVKLDYFRQNELTELRTTHTRFP